ncbi:MAG: HAD family hydrolase [Puniceicoccaceae bacterium]
MIIFNPPEKSYAGYIFDCDGTLANSMPLHLDAWNHGLAAANASLRIDGRNFMSVAGMALIQTIEHWNKTHSLQVDAEIVVEAKNSYFEAHRSTIQPITPVTDFARRCKLNGAAVSVASGGTRVDVLETLDSIGLGELFLVVVTAEDVKRAKPAPDLFLLAAEKMGIAPSDCLVIEDSPLGVEGAELAGMDSILIPHVFDEERETG